MSASDAPPLPPRDPSPGAQGSDESAFSDSAKTSSPPTPPPKVPPALPARSNSVIPTYTMESPMALILMYRQGELLQTLEMATPVGSLANLPIDVKAKLAESLVGEERWAPSEEFWVDMTSNYSNEYIRGQDLSIFEERILGQIPSKIRAALYLSVLNVRSILDPKNYQGLLRKARATSYDDLGLSKSSVSAQSDIVQVFEVYAKESSSITSQLLNEFKLQLVSGLSSHFHEVQSLNTQEQLALLFKVDAIFQIVSWEEYYYKGTCGLENRVPHVLAHLKQQQVDATCIFKNVSFNLFSNMSTASDFSHIILDLFIFEGFDYLLRLAIALTQKVSATIVSLEGTSLHAYLSSEEFLQCVDREVVQNSTGVDFPIIKYENKFKLANSNFCSGNDNELSNLKEANFDLEARLTEMKSKLASLRKVHAEVQQDTEEYQKKLEESISEKEMLAEKKKSLEEKYSHLTMNENLTNTIKANHDIFTANAELSAQLEELKTRVEKKREKSTKRLSIIG